MSNHNARPLEVTLTTVIVCHRYRLAQLAARKVVGWHVFVCVCRKKSLQIQEHVFNPWCVTM